MRYNQSKTPHITENYVDRSIRFLEKFKDLECLYLGKYDGNCPIARHLCYHKYLIIYFCLDSESLPYLLYPSDKHSTGCHTSYFDARKPSFFSQAFIAVLEPSTEQQSSKGTPKKKQKTDEQLQYLFFFINLIPYLTVL